MFREEYRFEEGFYGFIGKVVYDFVRYLSRVGYGVKILLCFRGIGCFGDGLN